MANRRRSPTGRVRIETVFWSHVKSEVESTTVLIVQPVTSPEVIVKNNDEPSEHIREAGEVDKSRLQFSLGYSIPLDDSRVELSDKQPAQEIDIISNAIKIVRYILSPLIKSPP